MPYIHPNRRAELEAFPVPAVIEHSGELNYLVTRLVLAFLNSSRGRCPRYADFNAAIGALECCKLELYRRMVASYEDIKIQENGDLYPR